MTLCGDFVIRRVLMLMTHRRTKCIAKENVGTIDGYSSPPSL
jgi:hypothetical protein